MGAQWDMQPDSPASTLELAASLTIDRAAELRAQLTEVLAASGRVILDFSRVEEVDLACLQVIFAARSSARASGKSLGFSGLPSPAAMSRLAAAGFLRPGPFGTAVSLENSLLDVR